MYYTIIWTEPLSIQLQQKHVKNELVTTQFH